MSARLNAPTAVTLPLNDSKQKDSKRNSDTGTTWSLPIELPRRKRDPGSFPLRCLQLKCLKVSGCLAEILGLPFSF